MARYAFYIARKTGNAAVKADGWHHRSDALSSLMVLAGLFLSPYFWWIDSVLGMLISFMLFYAAYGIIREAVNKILGEEPSEEVIGKVEQIVKAEMGNVAYPASLPHSSLWGPYRIHFSYPSARGRDRGGSS